MGPGFREARKELKLKRGQGGTQKELRMREPKMAPQWFGGASGATTGPSSPAEVWCLILRKERYHKPGCIPELHRAWRSGRTRSEAEGLSVGHDDGSPPAWPRSAVTLLSVSGPSVPGQTAG